MLDLELHCVELGGCHLIFVVQDANQVALKKCAAVGGIGAHELPSVVLAGH